MTDREKFEAEYSRKGLDCFCTNSFDLDSDGEYIHPQTKMCFGIWQAALASQHPADDGCANCEELIKLLNFYGVDDLHKAREQHLKYADDGWIKWGGGECPVGDCELVVAKLRDGTVLIPLSAGHLAWWHNEPGFCNGRDIIAYRLVKP